MKTLTERLAKVNERRESLARRVVQLREIGGEGRMALAATLEDSKLVLDQRAFELNLAIQGA